MEPPEKNLVFLLNHCVVLSLPCCSLPITSSSTFSIYANHVKPSSTPTTCERPSATSHHLYKHKIFPVKARTTCNRPHLVSYRHRFLGWPFYCCLLFSTSCTWPPDSWSGLYVHCVQCATQTLCRACSENYTYAINSKKYMFLDLLEGTLCGLILVRDH